MYLSPRETLILEHLITYRKSVNIETLEDLLKVSRRTVYRELANLELSLSTYNVEIIKPWGEGYSLSGSEEDIKKVKKKLLNDDVPIFDMQTRQRALLVLLMLNNLPLSVEELANEFDVSPNTIHNDITALTELVEVHDLKLQYSPREGYQIIGNEEKIRQISASIIDNNVKEIDFYQYLNKLEANNLMPSKNYFLQMISPESLYYAFLSFEQPNIKKMYFRVTDRQMQQLLITIALSFDRINQNYLIKKSEGIAELSKESLIQAHTIAGELGKLSGFNLSLTERHFIANQLEGINLRGEMINIFLDSFDAHLAYKMRNFIGGVSMESGIDFRYDDKLFENLLMHMNAALRRPITISTPTRNKTLERIVEQYKELDLIVQQVFVQIFPDEKLSREELIYLLIHFATAYERLSKKNKAYSVVLINPSEIANESILVSRLQNNIPQLKKIETYSVSQINSIDPNEYTLIISTIPLKDVSWEYLLVSPLLHSEDFKKIKDHLKVNDYQLSEISHQIEQLPLSFDEYHQYFKTAKDLLEHFEIQRIDSKSTIESTIKELMTQLEGTYITDISLITKKVIERYLIAPIGIPNSNIALFHQAHSEIKQPLFKIYDLSNNFYIPGMDGHSIELNRILLMLAPASMEDSVKYFLGIISQTIIQNDINLELFNHGDQKEIKTFLEQIFIQGLKSLA